MMFARMKLPITSLLFALMVFFCQGVLAQQQKINNEKNTIFLEYSFEGLHYSLNYERIIINSKSLFYSLRAGVSAAQNRIGFPFGGSINSGHNAHHAEFTVVLTPMIEKHYLLGSNNVDNDAFLYIFPALGYRYQKYDGGFFFHGVVGPMVILDPTENDFWNMDPVTKLSFSIGAGITFGK